MFKVYSLLNSSMFKVQTRNHRCSIKNSVGGFPQLIHNEIEDLFLNKQKKHSLILAQR